MNYTNEDLRKDIVELKVENRTQTLAVIVFFFFGVATVYDLSKRLK